MPNTLPQKKLDEMFAAYVGKQSILHVANKCAVSRDTVRKYKNRLDWDARLKDVQQLAVEKGNGDLAESIAANLKYVEFVKAKLLEEVTAIGIKSTNTIADLDKAIRVELLLRGEADSRPETKTTKSKDKKELKELLKQKKKQLKDFNSN